MRDLIASALYEVKAYSLPSVCERYGLEKGTEAEAFSSKTRYVLRRLEKLPNSAVLEIAKAVLEDFPDDRLRRAVEDKSDDRKLSDITRKKVLSALDRIDLAIDGDLVSFLCEIFPEIRSQDATDIPFESLEDEMRRHIHFGDWSNSQLFICSGLMSCSRSKFFKFLDELVHPMRSDEMLSSQVMKELNPLLRKDGFQYQKSGEISGHSVFAVNELVSGSSPADDLVSSALVSVDPDTVHAAWEKALSRRNTDPDGAITSARSLLETTCKSILDSSGVGFDENIEMTKLYKLVSKELNLSPSQHSEQVFRSILGGCNSVVVGLASVRNRLGDSHGKRRNAPRPQPRHAQLAVNLAGAMSLYLIETFLDREER